MHPALPLALLAALAAAPVGAAELVRQARFAADPEDIWAAIGGICGAASWQPGITACVADGPRRTLTLADGSQRIERELERDDAAMRLAYTIEAGALPVSDDFRATLAVTDLGDRARVTWRAEFTPADGVDDAMATAMIARIMSAGLEILRRRIGE